MDVVGPDVHRKKFPVPDVAHFRDCRFDDSAASRGDVKRWRSHAATLVASAEIVSTLERRAEGVVGVVHGATRISR
jgi:hypothetical protein